MPATRFIFPFLIFFVFVSSSSSAQVVNLPSDKYVHVHLAGRFTCLTDRITGERFVSMRRDTQSSAVTIISRTSLGAFRNYLVSGTLYYNGINAFNDPLHQAWISSAVADQRRLLGQVDLADFDAAQPQCQPSSVSPTPPPTPPVSPDVLRIDTGGAGGNGWLGDRHFSGGSITDRGTAFTVAGLNIPSHVAQTDRFSSYGRLDYEIPVNSGTFRVKLHFVEGYSGITGPGQRVFAATVENAPTSEIDVFAEAGFARLLTKEFPVSVSDGYLTVSLTAIKQNPMISALEVIRTNSSEAVLSSAGDKRPRNTRSPMGTNVSGVGDATGNWEFVDAFKQSRPWISGTTSQWEDTRSVTLDQNGWVRSLLAGQLARTILFAPPAHTYAPSGIFTVIWDGSGTMDIAGQQFNSANGGSMTVTLTQSPLIISILATDPNNYLRNIRVINPGGSCAHDETSFCTSSSQCTNNARCIPFTQTYRDRPFHPLFLAMIREYNTLRFMDWQNINWSAQKSWSDRPLPATAHFSGPKGVPLETILNLANRMNANAWLTVPHQADDFYVHSMAQLVKSELEPKLKVWLEYSNETWNELFADQIVAGIQKSGQYTYCARKGAELGLAHDEATNRRKFKAIRSRQIFDIWEFQLGGLSRMVRVLAGFMDDSAETQYMLNLPELAGRVDAYAIAPYIGYSLGSPENAAATKQLTPGQIIAKIKNELFPVMRDQILRHVALTNQKGIPLVAYEGGNHMAGSGSALGDDQLFDLFTQTNRHSDMEWMYYDFFNLWKALGGKQFVHFVECSLPTRWGAFGAREYLTQGTAQSPKELGILRYIGENLSP